MRGKYNLPVLFDKDGTSEGFDKLLQALYLSKEGLAKTLYEFLRNRG